LATVIQYKVCNKGLFHTTRHEIIWFPVSFSLYFVLYLAAYCRSRSPPVIWHMPVIIASYHITMMRYD